MCYNLATKRGHTSLLLMYIRGDLMDLEKVREIVLEIIKDTDYSLYDVKEEKSGSDLILQVFIDKVPHIDINELALLNDKISSKLDEVDSTWPPYYLEVSSPGAEKELRNIEEIKANINSYIYVETSTSNYYGYLLECNDDNITVKINLKGRIKKQTINLSDIKFIRLAVKV